MHPDLYPPENFCFHIRFPTRFLDSWKTWLSQRKEKNKVTINMWTLLNKQVLKRHSTATIKCLGQDVHQSVVFQKNKIPNKSSMSINGRTSQRKSYSAVHEKWRGAILHYTCGPSGCNLSFTSWYLAKICRQPTEPSKEQHTHDATLKGSCILY